MKEKTSQTKIVVITFEDIFAADGTTVRVQRMLELLNQKYSIILIANSAEGQKNLPGMNNVSIIGLSNKRVRRLIYSKSVPIPVKLFFALLWNIKVAFALLKNKFDIVYCAHEWIGFGSVYLISIIRKYKVIFEAHSIYSKDYKEQGHSGILAKLDTYWERFVIKHSSFVMALSEDTLKYYRGYNSRIDLFHVFVDTALFKAADKPKTGAVKLIGLIGPFDNDLRGKYHLEFLYSRVNEFDNRIRFVVIGRCPARIDHERIRYTGYLNSLHEYIDQLSRLDAVLVPEKISTQGPLNKILEPMACAVPVFTTRKGIVGLSWIEPGKDILVFEEHELVAKVNELIVNDTLMAEVSKNARKLVECYYSKRANEEKFINVLDALVRNRL